MIVINRGVKSGKTGDVILMAIKKGCDYIVVVDHSRKMHVESMLESIRETEIEVLTISEFKSKNGEHNKKVVFDDIDMILSRLFHCETIGMSMTDINQKPSEGIVIKLGRQT